MPKGKKRRSKRKYIVHSKGPIIPIDEWPNTVFGRIKKPTLHAKGGLMRKHKQAKRGF